MKKYFLHILLTIISFFICVLPVVAQNLGITAPGTISYPQTTIGNVLTEASGNAGNFLIFNSYTTTAPLTAVSMSTYGSASGTISVCIYNDNSGTPGTKLFTEVSASVTANTLSTIAIPATYLPAGTYWLAYDMNSSSASANYITKSTGVTGYIRKSIALTYGTSFPNNPVVSNLASGNQDHISFKGVAIRGYAKATKATLGINGTFSSVNFYTHAAGNARLAIYNDASGVPSAKQWESADITIDASGQPKLTTVNISAGTPSTLVLNAGTYWLAWQWNSLTNGPSYTAGAASTGNSITLGYGTFPSSWSGGTASTDNWTIYASYVCTPPATPAAPDKSTCNGTTATLTASGAVSGDKYKWYDAATAGTLLKTSTNNTDNTYTTVVLTIATDYWVSILNSTGCESARTKLTVTVNANPSTSFVKTDVSCFSIGDGEIVVTGSGGASPYTYSKDNGGAYQGSNTFGSLSPGTYLIRVMDSNGCESRPVQ